MPYIGTNLLNSIMVDEIKINICIEQGLCLKVNLHGSSCFMGRNNNK